MASPITQRLRDFLAAKGGEADLLEICSLAFAAQTSPALAKRLLEAALPGELQFQGDRVLWLAPARADDDLSAARYVVVDLETTGTNPHAAEIIEFGAVVVEGERIVGEEHSLVRPRNRIPPFIQGLTGIDNEMVADAPAFAEVAPRLHAVFQGAVPVAHNAEFDFGFLRTHFGRLGLADVGDGRLCTIKLARRFAPARHYNLDALAARLGVEAKSRHRALGDARTTAHVLIELLRAARAQGFASVQSLRKAKPQRGRGVETRLQVGPDRVRAIPERPGVYRFRNAAGEVIYVGKAADLRRRLGSYFVGSPKGKVARMLADVKDFDYTVVGSDLEALLEEAREIRTRRPQYNMALRSFRRYGYFRWERDDPFPVLRYAKEPGAPERFESYGPFRMSGGGRAELTALRETFALRNCRGLLKPQASLSPCIEHAFKRCGAPCALLQDQAGYQAEVHRLRAFFEGDKAAIAGLRHEIALAAKREAYERAAALRDRYRTLAALHQTIRREGVLANLGDRIFALPAAEDGLRRLYYLRPGASIATLRVTPRETDWPSALTKLLAPAPADLGVLDDARIAEAWVRRKTQLPMLRVAEFPDLAALAAGVAALVDEAAPATPAAL